MYWFGTIFLHILTIFSYQATPTYRESKYILSDVNIDQNV